MRNPSDSDNENPVDNYEHIQETLTTSDGIEMINISKYSCLRYISTFFLKIGSQYANASSDNNESTYEQLSANDSGKTLHAD